MFSHTSSAEHDFCDIRPYVDQTGIYPFRSIDTFRSPLGRVNPALRTMDLFRFRFPTDAELLKTSIKQTYDLVFVHNCRFSQAPGLIRFLQTKSIYYCGEPPRGFYRTTGSPAIFSAFIHSQNSGYFGSTT